LQRVPDIAAAHHEKLDGTGYPKGLVAAQLAPEARMLAIADIFEALTASDRPYKPGHKLSRALSIMAGMRDQRHIDADLFELFLRSGVYLDYAQRFMRPEQIDPVDIDAWLAPRSA
jgi:HD-GYP domain-containing protein (c-di-GMP phosphodiesterase class II)